MAGVISFILLRGANYVEAPVAAAVSLLPVCRCSFIGDLFDHWLSRAKKRKKTWAEDQRKWANYFQPLRSKRLASIKTADVARWHDKLGEEHGPYLANRCRALLSAMYGVAHELGYEGGNPCRNVKRFPEESRESPSNLYSRSKPSRTCAKRGPGELSAARTASDSQSEHRRRTNDARKILIVLLLRATIHARASLLPKLRAHSLRRIGQSKELPRAAMIDCYMPCCN